MHFFLRKGRPVGNISSVSYKFWTGKFGLGSQGALLKVPEKSYAQGSEPSRAFPNCPETDMFALCLSDTFAEPQPGPFSGLLVWMSPPLYDSPLSSKKCVCDVYHFLRFLKSGCISPFIYLFNVVIFLLFLTPLKTVIKPMTHCAMIPSKY